MFYRVLNPHQFGDDSEHPGVRYIEGGNGRSRYRLNTTANNMVEARIAPKPATEEGTYRPGRRVGAMTWFGGQPRYDGSNIDGGAIHKVFVSGPHRRKGVATAMLDFARERYPEQDIRHSSALSEDGAAWAASTPTENDVRTVQQRLREA